MSSHNDKGHVESWIQPFLIHNSNRVEGAFSPPCSVKKGCWYPSNLLKCKVSYHFPFNTQLGTNIPSNILSLQGQRVKQITHNPDLNQAVIHYSRDRRRKVVDPVTGHQGTVNQYVQRKVTDLPLFGCPCVIDLELAQVWISKNERRLEECDFVDKGCRYTKRFCRLVSGLCRHMSIQAVSRHLKVR